MSYAETEPTDTARKDKVQTKTVDTAQSDTGQRNRSQGSQGSQRQRRELRGWRRAVGALRSTSARRRWVLVAAALMLVGLPALSLTDLGHTAALGRLLGADGEAEWLTYEVQRRDLKITVLASGMLESASTKEVLSEVEGQVQIIRMLKRGEPVNKGDTVVELDSSALTTALLQQRVVVQQARAAAAQAKEALQIARSQAESDVNTASLAVRFAALDQRKYLEGDYPQELRMVQSEITLAQEELKRARDRIRYSSELKELGYLSEGQVDADRLVVLRSEEAVKLSVEKKRLLQEFTHTRMQQEHQSRVDEANRALTRARALVQAAVDQTETKLAAQLATEELEQAKARHLEEQIAKCLLRAPQSGVVLYPMPAGEDEIVIKEGTLVRQHQHVFTIPDTDSLQVSASVHEASVHLVKPGKTAQIRVDSIPDQEMRGTVKDVSRLPDLQSWRKSTVNFYPAKVLIEDSVSDLRPGMNAKVEILIKSMDSVLAIPVNAVLRSDKKAYCLVQESRGTSVRAIRLGKSNDEFVEIREGLSEGERVVLSPDEVKLELPGATNQEKSDKQKR